MSAVLDHLVIAASTLEAGVVWCEAALGITPGAGGKHPSMGTHNRLFSIGARAYAEIIAIDPAATAPGRVRWFDLDNEELRASIADRPRLVHWVARVPNIDGATAALAAQGVDRGRLLEASRATPHGELRWRITVRDDGARLLQGALPTLIEWGAAHPADTMTGSGVTLVSLTLRCEDAQVLESAFATLGAQGVHVQSGAPALEAVLTTPRGAVNLAAPI